MNSNKKIKGTNTILAMMALRNKKRQRMSYVKIKRLKHNQIFKGDKLRFYQYAVIQDGFYLNRYVHKWFLIATLPIEFIYIIVMSMRGYKCKSFMHFWSNPYDSIALHDRDIKKLVDDENSK